MISHGTPKSPKGDFCNFFDYQVSHFSPPFGGLGGKTVQVIKFGFERETLNI